MRPFYLLFLLVGTSLAAPTLEHLLDLKERLFGGHGNGGGYNRGGYIGRGHHGGHRGDHHQHHRGNGESGQGGNSQIVYVQNGQQMGYDGAAKYGASPSNYPGYIDGAYAHKRPHFGSNRYEGAPQSVASAGSSSWSNSGYGGGYAAGAQASATAWSAGNAGYD